MDPSFSIADHAAGKIAADVGLGGEVMFHAVELGFVVPEAVRADAPDRAIARQHQPAFGAAADEAHILEAQAVRGKLRAGNALHADLHHAALCQRHRPDVLIQLPQWKPAPGLPVERGKVREVQGAVARKVRVQQHIVQALCADLLDGRQALDVRPQVPSARMMRIRPCDCSTRISLPGRKAMLQAPVRPVATTRDLRRHRCHCRWRRVGLSRERRLRFRGRSTTATTI